LVYNLYSDIQLLIKFIKTFLLLDFGGELYDKEIEDPLNFSTEQYKEAMKNIEKGVEKVIKRIIKINNKEFSD